MNYYKQHHLIGKTWHLHPRSIAIRQLTPQGKLIKEWESMNIIEKELWVSRSHISRCIKENKLAYWFLWEKISETTT